MSFFSDQVDFSSDCCETVPVDEVLYVDDAMYFVTASPAELLIPKIAETVSVVVECLEEHNLAINWGIGKTEVVITPAGEGSQRLRDLIGLMGQKISVRPDDPTSPCIRVVHQYCHLGTLHLRSPSLLPEVNRRHAASVAASQALKRVLSSAGVGLKHKRVLIESIMLSRTTFQACTWGPLNAKQEGVLERAYVAAANRALGRSSMLHQLLDAEQLQTYGFPLLSNILRTRRLAYAARIVASAPILLLALIQRTMSSPSSWGQMLVRDFEWARTHEFAELPLAADNPGNWQTYLAVNSSAWRKRIHGISARLRDAQLCATADRRDQSLHVQRQYGAEVGCPYCGVACWPGHHLSLHIVREHKVTSAANLFATSDALCRICLRQFATRRLLVHHLHRDLHKRWGSTCLFQHVLRGVRPMTEDELRPLLIADSLR